MGEEDVTHPLVDGTGSSGIKMTLFEAYIHAGACFRMIGLDRVYSVCKKEGFDYSSIDVHLRKKAKVLPKAYLVTAGIMNNCITFNMGKPDLHFSMQHAFENGSFTSQKWVHKSIDAIIPESWLNVDKYVRE